MTPTQNARYDAIIVGSGAAGGTLASGYRRASEILRHAGAKKIFTSRVVAAHPGGTIRIGEHVDANLQTKYEGLYVGDCSAIADPWGFPPVLTLISLAKHLA